MGVYIPNIDKPKDCWECVDNFDIECCGDIRNCPLIDIVHCGECKWKEECAITELWGDRGFCPSGERKGE